MFDAILINKDTDEQTVSRSQVTLPEMEEGDVIVDIAWSTLNYKDALAIKDGFCAIPQGPGLGVEIDPVALEEMTVAREVLRR